MEFNVTMEIGLGLGNISMIAHSIINDLNEKLKNKDFGESIKQIIVSVVCVAPEFETFFKSRKPKFVSGKKTIKKYGTEYEIDSLLTYDLKLDYRKIKLMNDSEVRIYVRKELFNSISIIKAIKFEDFDIYNFEKELRDFLYQDQ
jgi:hypothetical protein